MGIGKDNGAADLQQSAVVFNCLGRHNFFLSLSLSFDEFNLAELTTILVIQITQKYHSFIFFLVRERKNVRTIDKIILEQ